ncbi:MAG: ribokinase [Thermoleophilales bacterium]|nr:ribokinase [Thermoleophilales bacterium]
MRVAVVGHVEWMEFVEVAEVPRPGEIVTARAAFAEPCGGGGVTAVQLARLAGGALFFTSLGDDELGHRAKRRLEELGLTVHVAWRDAPTRRGFTFLDDDGERTITVIGERHAPHGEDDLPWDELRDVDGCFLTAADPDAARLARAARTLVATSRVLPLLRDAGVELDALVGSGADEEEQYVDGQLEPPPKLVVRTAGARGGSWVGVEGRTGRWKAVPLPGPRKDAFGCGDSFAGGLTYGLADGRGVDGALELAARCGAYCYTGRGPYERQLTDPG